MSGLEKVKNDEIEEEIEENKMPDDSNKKEKAERFWVILSSGMIPFLVSIAAAMALSSFFVDIGGDLFFGKKISETERLNRYLGIGLKNDLFSEEYFDVAFNHFDRKSDGKLSKYGRIETLEDFVIYINSSVDNAPVDRIGEVNFLIKKSKEIEPFSALPAEEKRLMDQLQVLLSLSATSEQVANTLNELKQVILARHKEYQRIESQNAWSLPLSFIGAFLTLVFGIWTTVLSIKQSRAKYQKADRSIHYYKTKDGMVRKIVTS